LLEDEDNPSVFIDALTRLGVPRAKKP